MRSASPKSLQISNATPAGVFLLDLISEAIALKGLGILILSYVLYDWFNYANCRRWTAEEFKGNLTALFFFSSLLAALAHGWQENLTLFVGRFAVYSLPGFALGLWLGIILSNKINPHRFKQIVLALLLVAGLRLLS